MAALGGLETLLGGLEANTRKVMTTLLRNLVPYLRFGPVDSGTKCENFQGYSLTSTTAASTGEFSIAHGMGRSPYRIMPCVDLVSSGGQLIPLQVTRPADASRIYLKSSVTNAVFSLYVE